LSYGKSVDSLKKLIGKEKKEEKVVREGLRCGIGVKKVEAWILDRRFRIGGY